MTTAELLPLHLPYVLHNHQAMNLLVESRSLQGNPLGDPSCRHNYILLPQSDRKSYPVIFHLSGYFSTGYQNFTAKTLDKNFVEKIDLGVKKKKIPEAVHVFVEATTYWGGSQFLNSAGCGQYQDYILKDLYPSVQNLLPVSSKPQFNWVVGGSSGGYGALHLVSQKNSPFAGAFAVAPDSFFEASLLPELFQAAPSLAQYKNFTALKKKIENGELQDKKLFFTLMNAVAMAHCYSPASAFNKDYLQFPVDLNTGVVDQKLWKTWLKHDPIHFLKLRKAHLKGKTIHLDVGMYDNFSLQFGARQIRDVLKSVGLKPKYSEFPGNHFGLSQRKLNFLEGLGSTWGRGA